MIQLRNKIIPSKFVLAPIAGYTDSPFRRIARQHGAGLVVTELVSAEGIRRKNRKTMEFLKFHEEEKPIALQIFGHVPEVMGDAAEIVQEMNPDIIDINMGCPSQKVCRSGSGAALLLNPEKIQAITENVVKRVKIPVTAKIRIGWDEQNKNYIDAVKALEDGGISLIFVHGRTKAQQYSGSADWDIIKEIREKSSVPIIGNGDINSYEQALERMDFSGCPAVMIGRGAIGNPWIFSGEKPELSDIFDAIIKHLELMIEYYGKRGIILMRKHIVKYIHGIKNASQIRRRLVTSIDKNEIIGILETILH